MPIAIPIWRRFLIGIASERLSTSLRNHYRHQFGIAIATARNLQQLLMQFVDEEHELMLGLFCDCRAWVSARREYLLKDGQTLVGGPDHYARLTARQAIPRSEKCSGSE